MISRAKVSWLEVLKQNILKQVGRPDGSITPINNTGLGNMNYSNIMNSYPNIENSSTEDDFVTEKIRSYYPACKLINTFFLIKYLRLIRPT